MATKSGDQTEKKMTKRTTKKAAQTESADDKQSQNETIQAQASEAKPSKAKPSKTASKEKSISTLDGIALPAASGKAGILGGPKDRGVKEDDKLALPTGKHFTYERVRSLNPKTFYCAMRWDYKQANKSPEEGKRWWVNKKILVTNPANGNQVIVRAVDYGPHENTGLSISLSPAALEALNIEIGDEVEIAFADQKAPLGIVQGTESNQ